MKHASRFGIAIAVVIACWALPAQARLRVPYEDAQVVERSELIVVAAIKDDSVVIVPDSRPQPPDTLGPWEYHATLLIHEVLKGECKEKELPIIIRYGLDVIIDDKRVDEDTLKIGKPVPLAKPQKSMSILDTGNSSFGGSPVADDARKDHIWMLHGSIETQHPDKSLGIEDPEDVQPLHLKKYLECYLAPDPEPAVRTALQTQPEIARRALRYLQHQEITRILKEKDPARRVELLLPYYQARVAWGFHEEARDAIIAAGEIAGPYLMTIYQNSAPSNIPLDLIRLIGQIRYKGAAETLIKILQQQDQFWAAQNVKPGWRNDNTDPSLTQSRQNSANLIYYSVYALGQIADPRAPEALELTRRRWAAVNFENPQIVEECDRALKAISSTKESPQDPQ